MNFREELGHRLVLLRHVRNMTQVEVAQKIGTTRDVISHWELGTRTVPADYIAKLATFYRVSSDYILGLKDGVLK